MSEDATMRLRQSCQRFPEVTERVSHGEPAWFIRDKKMFVMLSAHHHDDRFGFWCAAPAGAAQALVSEDGDRFFIPPYVGHRGWLGVYLDVVDLDWTEIDEVVADAFACVAPKRPLAQWEG